MYEHTTHVSFWGSSLRRILHLLLLVSSASLSPRLLWAEDALAPLASVEENPSMSSHDDEVPVKEEPTSSSVTSNDQKDESINHPTMELVVTLEPAKEPDPAPEPKKELKPETTSDSATSGTEGNGTTNSTSVPGILEELTVLKVKSSEELQIIIKQAVREGKVVFTYDGRQTFFPNCKVDDFFTGLTTEGKEHLKAQMIVVESTVTSMCEAFQVYIKPAIAGILCTPWFAEGCEDCDALVMRWTLVYPCSDIHWMNQMLNEGKSIREYMRAEEKGFFTREANLAKELVQNEPVKAESAK